MSLGGLDFFAFPFKYCIRSGPQAGEHSQLAVRYWKAAFTQRMQPSQSLQLHLFCCLLYYNICYYLLILILVIVTWAKIVNNPVSRSNVVQKVNNCTSWRNFGT